MPAARRAARPAKKAQNLPGLTGSPAANLSRMIARFSPEVESLARAALTRMRKRFPTANRFVFDNYNGLGIGFTPSESSHDTIFSIVLYPRRVSLFFLQAMRSNLEDPLGLLHGGGNLVRFIPLESAATIDSAPVRRLMADALKGARVKMPLAGKGRLVIKSIAAKQMPRRP